ncbi:MAG: C25 family cysteine peptidase, partial [Candidatus Thermoplasmatota archaeon]|nr:C25 family cysteine peptidase [Candidatus Thermoplasmatota archaeon]
GIYAEWKMMKKDVIDFYPDVYVGRLACRNSFEVKKMVEKIITYETTTYGQEWFKKFVGIAGDTFAYPDDPYYEGELGVSVTVGYLEDNGFDITTLFTSDGTLGTLTGANDIIDAISQGCGFLNFEGHGNPMSWANHPPHDGDTWIGIDVTQFNKFSNEDMYPICMVGGCHNSQFNVSLLNLMKFKEIKNIYYKSEWSPESWSWWMARKIDGGAIATIGSTGLGYGTIGDDDKDGIPDCIQYLGGFIDSEFFRVYTDGTDILGETHGTAITNYIAKFPPMKDKIDAKTVEEWSLLGDPSLKIGGYPS